MMIVNMSTIQITDVNELITTVWQMLRSCILLNKNRSVKQQLRVRFAQRIKRKYLDQNSLMKDGALPSINIAAAK